MNKLLVLFVVMLSVNFSFSQSFVQTYADVRYVGDGKFVPSSYIFAMKNSEGAKVGLSAFALVSYDWAEVLVGPYYRVSPELSIGVQAGFETIAPYWRLGFSTVYFKNNNLLMLFMEKGAGSDNYWYSVEYQNTQNTFVWGLIGARWYGWGPNLGIKIKSNIVTFGPLYDFESKQFQPTIFWKWQI